MIANVIDDCLDAAPAESEAAGKQTAALEAEILELQQQGWRWNRSTYEFTHPDNPDAAIWINPYTGQKFLSPKLIALLREVSNRGYTVVAVEGAWKPT